MAFIEMQEGLSLVTARIEGKVEFETVSCCHCKGLIAVLHREKTSWMASLQTSVVKNPATVKDAERGITFAKCPRCRDYICKACVKRGGCMPWKERVERAIAGRRKLDEFDYHYRTVAQGCRLTKGNLVIC